MKKLIRNYLKLINEIINIQSPFDTEILGILNYDRSYPFIGLYAHSKLAKWNVVINSGSHGTEAIGVRTIIRFLQEFNREYLGYYSIILFPIVNPYGFSYGVRKNGKKQYGNSGFIQAKEENLTQEAKIIREAIPNKIDLFIDIHADNKEAFYIYERKRPNAISLAEKSLQELKKHKFPVMNTGTIYKEKCENGVIISPERDASMDNSMFNRGAIYSLCLEIPTKIPEDQQLVGGILLVDNILKIFREIIK